MNYSDFFDVFPVAIFNIGVDIPLTYVGHVMYKKSNYTIVKKFPVIGDSVLINIEPKTIQEIISYIPAEKFTNPDVPSLSKSGGWLVKVTPSIASEKTQNAKVTE